MALVFVLLVLVLFLEVSEDDHTNFAFAFLQLYSTILISLFCDDNYLIPRAIWCLPFWLIPCLAIWCLAASEDDHTNFAFAFLQLYSMILISLFCDDNYLIPRAIWCLPFWLIPCLAIWCLVASEDDHTNFAFAFLQLYSTILISLFCDDNYLIPRAIWCLPFWLIPCLAIWCLVASEDDHTNFAFAFLQLYSTILISLFCDDNYLIPRAIWCLPFWLIPCLAIWCLVASEDDHTNFAFAFLQLYSTILISLFCDDNYLIPRAIWCLPFWLIPCLAIWCLAASEDDHTNFAFAFLQLYSMILISLFCDDNYLIPRAIWCLPFWLIPCLAIWCLVASEDDHTNFAFAFLQLYSMILISLFCDDNYLIPRAIWCLPFWLIPCLAIWCLVASEDDHTNFAFAFLQLYSTILISLFCDDNYLIPRAIWCLPFWLIPCLAIWCLAASEDDHTNFAFAFLQLYSMILISLFCDDNYLIPRAIWCLPFWLIPCLAIWCLVASEDDHTNFAFAFLQLYSTILISLFCDDNYLIPRAIWCLPFWLIPCLAIWCLVASEDDHTNFAFAFLQLYSTILISLFCDDNYLIPRAIWCLPFWLIPCLAIWCLAASEDDHTNFAFAFLQLYSMILISLFCDDNYLIPRAIWCLPFWLIPCLAIWCLVASEDDHTNFAFAFLQLYSTILISLFCDDNYLIPRAIWCLPFWLIPCLAIWCLVASEDDHTNFAFAFLQLYSTILISLFCDDNYLIPRAIWCLPFWLIPCLAIWCLVASEDDHTNFAFAFLQLYSTILISLFCDDNYLIPRAIWCLPFWLIPCLAIWCLAASEDDHTNFAFAFLQLYSMILISLFCDDNYLITREIWCLPFWYLKYRMI